MILFGAIGYAGLALFSVKVLFPIAVLAGLIVAPMVPVKSGGCAKAPES